MAGAANVNQGAAQALRSAGKTTQQAMNFQPGKMAAQGYNPAQASSYIGQYQNPYEQQVIDASMRDINRQQQQSLNQLGAQATQAGAFGGDRFALESAETRRGFAQTAADTAARMRQQGFNTALGAAQNQAAAQTAASQFGATAGMNAQQFNIGNQMSANQSRLGAAQQLAGLGQQAFGIGQTIQQNQAQQGLLQQGIQQALIDAAKAQFAGYSGAPMASLQAPLAALGAAPNVSTTTQSMQPGLFNYLQLGASLNPFGGR